MSTQVVDLTEEHIKHGKAMDCETCPMALALNEGTDITWYVNSRFAARGWHDGPWYYFDETIVNAIQCFDTYDEMSPMTLIIHHDDRTIEKL